MFTLALFCAFAIVWGLITLSEYREISNWEQITRIVPYFEKAVPGVDTFFNSGHSIARNYTKLDDIANKWGFPPLSDYGFEDDYLNETELHMTGKLKWYDPEQGLVTINNLLDHLDEINDASERIKIKADLDRLKFKLKEARDLGVRFCFHLRIDSGYTGLEFDNRIGRYFPTWQDQDPSLEV
ncbi:MAG: hypothetical protein KY468_15275 [Armatimonadetes bacterium]|nr:hypothetical protein [Armatimonadota bacterium]